MEHISLKLEKNLAQALKKGMKEFNYSTKTEVIREALRDKIKQWDEERKKEIAWNNLFKMRGILKGKERFKTDEEWHNWRSNEGSEEVKKYCEKKFGITLK